MDFIQGKIAADPDGENAEVVVAESQVLYLLATLG